MISESNQAHDSIKYSCCDDPKLSYASTKKSSCVGGSVDLYQVVAINNMSGIFKQLLKHYEVDLLGSA